MRYDQKFAGSPTDRTRQSSIKETHGRNIGENCDRQRSGIDSQKARLVVFATRFLLQSSGTLKN